MCTTSKATISFEVGRTEKPAPKRSGTWIDTFFGKFVPVVNTLFAEAGTLLLISSVCSISNFGPRVKVTPTETFSVGRNSAPMIGLLMDAGADPSVKNAQGQTAEDVANMNGNQEAAQAIKVLSASRAAQAPQAADNVTGESSSQ